MSIRLRLTLLYSAIVALTVIAFSVALYVAQSESTLDAIRGELAERVYVAEVDSRPAGFIAVEMDRDAEAYFKLRMGHIPWIGTGLAVRGGAPGIRRRRQCLLLAAPP